ncbi:Hypothetical predicted protein [Pelobates cultripes]|uniref:Uncharacterized protein n=1 Tax=Pelobates cultripes TaxID=61616 RepID=A0AAD1SXT5_PELCU|nr:Hypothetical predicted protein [Pelobates cultripes]
MLQESLGWVFEDCFPSYSPPVIEDDIKPLEPPQPASGDLTTSPSHSQSATCLWGAVCDRRTHPNRQCKWEGSKLHNSYLSSLHIDPNDKVTVGNEITAQWKWVQINWREVWRSVKRIAIKKNI